MMITFMLVVAMGAQLRPQASSTAIGATASVLGGEWRGGVTQQESCAPAC